MHRTSNADIVMLW